MPPAEPAPRSLPGGLCPAPRDPRPCDPRGPGRQRRCCRRSGRCLRKWGAGLPRTPLASSGWGGAGRSGRVGLPVPRRPEAGRQPAARTASRTGPDALRSPSGGDAPLFPADGRLGRFRPGPSHGERRAGSELPSMTFSLCDSEETEAPQARPAGGSTLPAVREHTPPQSPPPPPAVWPKANPWPLQLLRSPWVEKIRRGREMGAGGGSSYEIVANILNTVVTCILSFNIHHREVDRVGTFVPVFT